MARRPTKVFGIGLSKTGTTSLTSALRLLGYSAVHSPSTLDEVDRHDAATDTTVADVFEALDTRHPGSRFIYTSRDREAWLRSCQGYWALMQERFDRRPATGPLHERLYGGRDFDRERFLAAWERHERRVRRHFASDPERLLVLDIFAEPDPWRPLCAFLGVEPPALPFPHDHDTRTIRRLLARHVAATGDVAGLARRAHVPVPYLEALREELPEPEAAGDPGGSALAARVVRCTHEVMGSVEPTARVLGITPAQVRAALDRSRRRRRRAWKRVGLSRGRHRLLSELSSPG